MHPRSSKSLKQSSRQLYEDHAQRMDRHGSPGILAEIGLSKQNIDDGIDEAYAICETVTAED